MLAVRNSFTVIWCKRSGHSYASTIGPQDDMNNLQDGFSAKLYNIFFCLRIFMFLVTIGGSK